MKSTSPRTLTWLTGLAALCSAVLLAGEDAGLPDLKRLATGAVTDVPMSVSPASRRAAPALSHRTRDVDARRREH